MKRRSDEEISAPLYAFDAEVRSQYGCFAGVDEAGRGPLCGPVCVAACILDPENPVYGINDSKKLTEKKREALFDEICEKALAYRIVFVGPEVIDRKNILNATMGGMQQAVEELDIVPNLVLVDGNRTPAGLQIPAQPVVKGDATSASIGAASVPLYAGAGQAVSAVSAGKAQGLPHKAALRADRAVRHSAVLPTQLP